MCSDRAGLVDRDASEPTIIQEIARHVCGADVRHQRLDDGSAMRRALVDTLAVGFAACREPIVVPVRQYVTDKRGCPTSMLWTSGTHADAESAAFFNALAAHALDYDDVSVPIRGHLSVVLFPALLALAEERGQTWGDVFDAYVIGTQVGCAMGQAFALTLSVRGWHTTSVIGMFAATAACARLLQLSEEQAAHALGISVAGLAGNLESFGTWSKPMQAARAASEAIRSARLAAYGFTGPVTAMEGPRGFTRLYVGSDDTAAFEKAWMQHGTEVFRVCDTLEIKKYPACYAAHRALDALDDLMRRDGIDAESVVRVDVLASRRSLTPLVYPRPDSGLQAKFSLPYCMAAMLVDGALRLSSFTNDAVVRPAIQAWMGRIGVRESDDAQTGRWAEVTVSLMDGSRHVARVASVRGSQAQPMTDEELLCKLNDCLDFGGVRADGAAVSGLLNVQDESRVSDDMAVLASVLSWPS